jgi:DNA-binding NarL/FixJ family response regulator
MAKKDVTARSVLLVDDHPVMRNGLTMLLARSGHVVCGSAASREELRACLEEVAADVALVDLSLAEESGLDLIDDLMAKGVPVLIFSMHEDSRSIERAFSRGAMGYVTKREVEAILLDAIQRVARGERYASPAVKRSLADRVMASQCDVGASLSPREEQILARLGRGESSSEIGAALSISAHTVETYFSRLIRKLDISSMKELRKYAICHGQRDDGAT